MHMWSTKKIQAFLLENIRAAYSNEKQMDTNDSIQTNASSPRSDGFVRRPKSFGRFNSRIIVFSFSLEICLLKTSQSS